MGRGVFLLTPAGEAVDGGDKLVLVLMDFMLDCRGSIWRGEERHQVRALRVEVSRQQIEMRVRNRKGRSHEQESQSDFRKKSEGINGVDVSTRAALAGRSCDRVSEE